MSPPNIGLQGPVRAALCTLTEDHISQLIREAVQVQRHCKRARMILPSDDATKAAGKDTKDRGPGIMKQRLHAEDINMALQWRGSEKIYATGTVGYPGKSNKGEDTKVVLKEYLNSEMDLKPPQEVGLTVHWLAVDGVQPDIPQNPVANKAKRKAAVVHRIEDTEEDGDDSRDGVQVTQLLPRLLSEELQLYFSRITSAVERGGTTPLERQQQDAALKSLAQDPGLQELVPFMINYVTKNLYKHVGNPEHCRTLIRMAHSLLVNPHLHLELYLHQLLPAILTMVVAKKLSSKPWDNHWSLRSEAAQCLILACSFFGDNYATLKAKVLRSLCDAIGPDKALTTQYGGIVAVSLFGPKAINAFILPLALEYWNQWNDTLARVGDLEKRTEIQMCQQATLNALYAFLGPENNQESPEALDMTWDDLEDTFGDSLVSMSALDEKEYSSCFV
ncbi:TAF6 C-terminal heat repeat domain containing protein [Nitzschia inconspicua]|uniref:TAF6 C-terminal heat repeat domain containing protein n=1 Tax=Nitzschia inconspicua TaxID=303405 RepID=A0A9K3KKU0_9STRA|nr:TAF6 C-terminal heat repeat domain containing protein [Nitzschia inconspicua]